jgi:hypothetical protein
MRRSSFRDGAPRARRSIHAGCGQVCRPSRASSNRSIVAPRSALVRVPDDGQLLARGRLLVRHLGPVTHGRRVVVQRDVPGRVERERTQSVHHDSVRDADGSVDAERREGDDRRRLEDPTAAACDGRIIERFVATTTSTPASKPTPRSNPSMTSQNENAIRNHDLGGQHRGSHRDA